MIPTNEQIKAFKEVAEAINFAAIYFEQHPDSEMDDALFEKSLPILGRIPMLNGYGHHIQLCNKIEKFTKSPRT